jgi:acylphosphatase
MNSTRLELRIQGRVQGVFYRVSAQQKAQRLALTGWVRNCFDGSVELVAEGSRQSCEALLEYCRQGPRGAHVDEVECRWAPATESFDDFAIRY